jgi:hypothetical protein
VKFIIAACLAATPVATGQGGYIQEFFNARKIRIFTLDGNAPLPGGKPHTLRAESLHNGEWTLEAENHLR